MKSPTPTVLESKLETPPPSALAEKRRAPAITFIFGRVLMAMLFILAGAAKILSPKPFLGHMTEFGVPTFLLPAVIALELGAGLALLIGWRLREAAAALGIFCLITAAVFHHQMAISAERTSLFKDLAIAGGLFAIAGVAAAKRTKRPMEGSGGSSERAQ